MTTTKTNPTGITEYDLTPFAQLPEWQALAQALNAVALAANRTETDFLPEGQDALAEAIAHLARGIAFMDCCNTCERSPDMTDPDHLADTSAAPYATTIEGRSLRGRYRCARGHEWTCGWAINRGLWP